MMPYINQSQRFLARTEPVGPGELNYAITMLLIEYVERHELDYQIINDVLGALDAAGKEFYRRVALPYEETKRYQNGDVYDDAA